jgi:hypothetical protein
MTNPKTSVAVAPRLDSRAVEIDRTVGGGPTNLTNAIGGLMDTLKSSLSNMDDVNIEVSAHSDQTRSSAHIKFRAYRHRGNGAA